MRGALALAAGIVIGTLWTSSCCGPVHHMAPGLYVVAGGSADGYSVRVVFSYRDVEFEGASTQYLTLTPDDIAELKKFDSANGDR